LARRVVLGAPYCPASSPWSQHVTVDLPCDDPGAGLDEYADTIAAALVHADEDVVVVAHSLGGLAAPLVAARRPVRAIVYLAAFVPVEGISMADQFAASPEPVLLLEGRRETDDAGRTRWTDQETTARLMYPDLCAADAHWAFALLRPQARRSQLDRCPTTLPRVRAVSLVCTYDRVINPAWSRRVARERLGVEPIELPTGHFPMITSPPLLADALVACAA
jgi:pimeloyl-ACP methyl ester carboxylesterase